MASRRKSARGGRSHTAARKAGRRAEKRAVKKARGGRRWPRLLLAAVLLLVAGIVAWELSTPASAANRVIYPVSYAEAIEDSAERHDVDPLLVCAVIRCESGWDASAVSSAGAIGLMQVMQDTADDLASMGLVDGDAYPASDLADPVVNIEYGCAYLGYLQERLSSIEEVVAAYNAGIGAVQSWLASGGTIPDDIAYEETSTYLTRVLEAYAAYERNYPLGIAAC